MVSGLYGVCLTYFPLQALSVATNAENQSKNGSDSVIPYDRNRVILTPDGARPHSTYINASFIEGYFNDESFIITQDPLQVGIRSYISCIVIVVMVTLSVCPPSQSIYGISHAFWKQKTISVR